MCAALPPEDLRLLAPGGHYIALRVGFAFAISEENAWPRNWVDHYTAHRFVLRDPVMRWVYGHIGTTRWSAIADSDPDQVLAQAARFGLRYGAAVAHRDGDRRSARSFGMFARADREYTEAEVDRLLGHIVALHSQMRPPQNLTKAELEALAFMREGLRQKEIAYRLGVTEGAVKQRLRNAKAKLGAKTAAQAATMAREYGLI